MYKEFSQFYDSLMQEVSYDKWAAFLYKKINNYRFKNCSILDAACGTGNLIYLLKPHYKIYGFDLSYQMCVIARNKNPDSYIWQCSMNKPFASAKSFNVIISAFDSLNYLNSKKELNNFFKHANTTLKKDGLLIFDIITKKRIVSMFKNNIFVHENRNISCIWYNRFLTHKTFVNELVFFHRLKNGLYEKIKEVHKRRIFRVDEILTLAKNNFFEIKGVYDNYEEKKICNNSERIVFIFQKRE
ncbi:MAG: class I SAM-dependent DNA methyltransferase [Candidatus Muiribacteriota bacterium]